MLFVMVWKVSPNTNRYNFYLHEGCLPPTFFALQLVLEVEHLTEVQIDKNFTLSHSQSTVTDWLRGITLPSTNKY